MQRMTVALQRDRTVLRLATVTSPYVLLLQLPALIAMP